MQTKRKTIAEKIKALRTMGNEVITSFVATITPSTVAQSERKDPNRCQIATPVQAAFPEATHVHVTLKKFKKGLRGFISFTLGRTRYKWETPPTLIPLIRNWDKYGLKPGILSKDGMPFTIDNLRDVKIGGEGSWNATHGTKSKSKTAIAQRQLNYRKRIASGAELEKRGSYGPRKRVDGICMRSCNA